MHVDLETLAIALYVKIDDELKAHPELQPAPPKGGITPRLSAAELLTMAVMQALLAIRSERRWVRYMGKNLRHLFPYQLKQSGYNKRLRAGLPLIQHFIRALAYDTDFWFDNHWILDSTPVECGRSRPTVKRSDAAGWAAYGSSYVKRCMERSWRGLAGAGWADGMGDQRLVNLAGDVAFEASNDLFRGLAFGGASGYVSPGSGIVGHPDSDDAPQRGVGLPVPAPVEPVAAVLAGGGIDRAGAAQRGEAGLAV